MTLIQIPLSWVQDIRKFTFTNGLANSLILYGLTLCLWFAFTQATQDFVSSETIAESSNATSGAAPDETVLEENDSDPIANILKHLGDLHPFGSRWILFIGTSVLLFEGSITLLLPLQEAVHPTLRQNQDLDDRARFPFVYQKTILCIQVFYVIFGVTCWMAFGDDVDTVLTVSLPPGFMATTVQLGKLLAMPCYLPWLAGSLGHSLIFSAASLLCGGTVHVPVAELPCIRNFLQINILLPLV